LTCRFPAFPLKQYEWMLHFECHKVDLNKAISSPDINQVTGGEAWSFLDVFHQLNESGFWSVDMLSLGYHPNQLWAGVDRPQGVWSCLADMCIKIIALSLETSCLLLLFHYDTPLCYCFHLFTDERRSRNQLTFLPLSKLRCCFPFTIFVRLSE
jgi:hypothetical protein